MTDYSYRVCPICGVHYAVDEVIINYKRGLPKGHCNSNWYCPNGHSLIFTESEADKWRQRASRAEQQLAMKDDEIAARNRQITAAKGQITKLKKRASGGVCPCCNRTFVNMARHMKEKHPEFADEPVLRVVNDK